MDYDASWLLTGSTTLLLNLIGFLILSAVALCTAHSSDEGGGHHHLIRAVSHANIFARMPTLRLRLLVRFVATCP